MKQLFKVMLLFSFIFGFGLTHAFAADKNCSDFATWRDAQNYFEANGGSPSYNFNGLDRDRDGIACETLRGYNGQTWAELHPTNGGALPDTATNYMNGIIGGLSITVLGSLLFFRKKIIK